jgi:murein DD-endopeptidase MepM/ murein hydrolase activator NlpD
MMMKNKNFKSIKVKYVTRFIFVFSMLCFVLTTTAQNAVNQENKKDTTATYTAYYPPSKKSLKNAVVLPLPTTTAKALKAPVGESLNDYYEEDLNDDMVDLGDIPSDELYNYSWTSDALNPYKIKIDNLPDSTYIDCGGFVFPIKSNNITSSFGPRRHRFHYGTDIGLNIGDSIVAAFEGTVRIVDYEGRGYGNYVVVRHPNGLESIYAHMSKSLVKVNQQVIAGELIGLGGSTGRSSGPHLHFELRFLGNAFNTAKIIDYEQQKCLDNFYYITKKETFEHSSDLKKLQQSKFHRVKPGETLSQIAKHYGTTVNKLCQLNHIGQNSIIRTGRSIRYR